ncbi:MAG: type III-B CRISPR module RAMP protein Cmr1 [Saccharolobus sp.]|uniref:type III-B CRISPR module RAMP protein Cmr1 n=2 Tax=Sulfolobaceae TaxID=118883 RepID=UPI001F1087FC|nr:type III-B CRISPR module RAMP protein Cmr1 [Saccharolobus shibatae]MCH4816209.1 type III-B CRISPR module RAMP protein Cmr1 [Saccharolobus shibatae]
MEELLMSLRLKALYPLTGGYNRHSKNQFYEEFVRPTEIKGLWRWWNRVLFNTASYANGGKLYTYDSIDRLFEDVFGSEDRKSAVRLEVISEEGSNFELSEVKLDKVVDYLKGYKGKISLDYKDRLIVKAENTQIPIYSKSNVNVNENKDLVFKNDLLKFELLGFSSIKIDATKISDKEVLKEILHDLITDYLEYFNIKREMEFTLNIYLDKNHEQGNFDAKLKFALYSLLIYILLGGIGRKTSRGFGSLSIVDIKCYNEVCSDLESYVKKILKVENGKELKEKLIDLIHSVSPHNIHLSDERHKLIEVNLDTNAVYYYFATNALEHIIFVNEIDPDKIAQILNSIVEAVTKGGKCIQLTQNPSTFLVLFCGNRKNEEKILGLGKYYKIFVSKQRRPSALRFKILMNNRRTFLLTYLLIPSYVEYVVSNNLVKLVKINYSIICKDLKTIADCVSKV